MYTICNGFWRPIYPMKLSTTVYIPHESFASVAQRE